MGIPEDAFWRMPLRVWIAALDAWASQFPERDEAEPITAEQWEEHKANLTDAQLASLGLLH